MIGEEEVFKIGKLLKPHGIKGEISFAYDDDIFDKVDCPYLILLIDNIFVPFFLKEYRFKGQDVALIKFENIDSDDKVRPYSNIEVFFPRKYMLDNEDLLHYTWNYFVGFSVFDVTTNKLIGVIDSVDDATMNILFNVLFDNSKEMLIPASEDLIVEVDNENKVLKMRLPEGFSELY